MDIFFYSIYLYYFPFNISQPVTHVVFIPRSGGDACPRVMTVLGCSLCPSTLFIFLSEFCCSVRGCICTETSLFSCLLKVTLWWANLCVYAMFICSLWVSSSVWGESLLKHCSYLTRFRLSQQITSRVTEEILVSLVLMTAFQIHGSKSLSDTLGSQNYAWKQ